MRRLNSSVVINLATLFLLDAPAICSSLHALQLPGIVIFRKSRARSLAGIRSGFRTLLRRAHMRSAIIITAFASMAIGSSFAQNAHSPTTPDTLSPKLTEPGNPAIKTTKGNNPGAPVTGANSFTEAQAKSWIESRGYANVSALQKDNRGIWRGTAMKDGKLVPVTLDFQGNVSCATCGLP
jgi:hypothetical protein